MIYNVDDQLVRFSNPHYHTTFKSLGESDSYLTVVPSDIQVSRVTPNTINVTKRISAEVVIPDMRVRVSLRLGRVPKLTWVTGL